MKKIFTFLITGVITFCASPAIYSQQWQTAKHMGGPGNDQGVCIATDSQGNVYVGGSFQWNGYFENQTVSSNGYSDFFLTKYSPSGSLIWIKHGGGGGTTLETSGDGIGSIFIDDQHRIFLAGSFNGTASFGNHTLTCYYGQMDAFLARYDTAGNCIWVRHMGGQYRTGSRAIVLDDTDHIYISGVSVFTDSLHCMDTAIAMNDHGFFLAKFDVDGNFHWLRSIEGSGKLNIQEMNYHSGGISLCGGYGGGETILDTIVLDSVGNLHPVLLGMDTSGKWISAITFDCLDNAWINSITMSGSGAVYGCGYAFGRLIVGNDTLPLGGDLQ